MSSGLPPIVPSASQQASAQQFAGNPFPHFGYLFGPNQSIPNPFALGQSSNSNANQQNRFKIKRHRQRVDAGEPRNTYQGTVKSRSQAQAPPQLPPQITPLLQLQLESLWNNQQQQQTIPNLQNEEVEETRSVREEIESSAEEAAKSGQETEEEVEEEDEEDNDDEEEEDNTKAESPSSTSSASKRKRFQPKKIEEQLGIEEEVEQISIAVGGSSTPEQEDNDNETTDDSSDDKPAEQSAIQAQLNAPPFSLLDAHKKMLSALFEQNKSRFLAQNKKDMNTEQLLESLKSEIADNQEKKNSEAPSSSSSTPSIEKIMPPHPIFHHPMFAAFAAAAAANGTHNPLFPSSPQAAIGGGIFPPSFNMFQQLQAFNAIRRNMVNEEPRKKRIKLEADTPTSCQSTPPTARYFPPTMVGHPMYGNLAFANLNLAAAAAAANLTDRENSPTNSDDMNDFGMYDGSGNSTLTPMHLRKAKLMFFYTRYPNSNLLKSYFPDIRFNKNNTAQLVKWFSNFREFYYIQMEKFGRQLLADGIRSRDDIFVNKDSELFKVLNTHYNRNNHIKAPDNLLYVVQETLREFYDAIRLGKDSEPSWKKTIYKIINRMDDQIPEFFKEPNFLDRLEG